jgi:hypothetical protein
MLQLRGKVSDLESYILQPQVEKSDDAVILGGNPSEWGAQNKLPFVIFFTILPKRKFSYLEGSLYGSKGLPQTVFG